MASLHSGRVTRPPGPLPSVLDKTALTTPPTASEPAHGPHGYIGNGNRNQLNPMFAREGEATDFPLDQIPDGETLPETAYQIVHDEAMLDGNARLNLATFVGTWMDPYATKLYAETADKNMVDKDEYPQTAAIETRCWKMMARLWSAPDAEKAIGTSTIGSPQPRPRGGRSPPPRSAPPRRGCWAGSP